MFLQSRFLDTANFQNLTHFESSTVVFLENTFLVMATEEQCLLIIVLSIHIISSQWIPGNATLPRSGGGWAVGSYNGSTFILGGSYEQRQIIEYQHHQNKFIDKGENASNATIKSWGAQFYVQKEEKIYMVTEASSYFTVFDMHSLQLTSQWQNLPLKQYVDTGACVAASDHHLFVTGGIDGSTYLDTLQMLSLSSHEWVNAPPMNHAREQHACVVHQDRLWVFSGWSGGSPNVETYERITIISTNVSQHSWTDITPLHGPRQLTPPPRIKNDVFIFNVSTDQFYQSLDTLLYGVESPGVTLVNDNIYLFGGGGDTGAQDTFMYYPLLPSLTTDPSKSPTLITVNPTVSTNIPTYTALTNHPSEPPSTGLPSTSPITKLPTSDSSTRILYSTTTYMKSTSNTTDLTQSHSDPPSKTPTDNPPNWMIIVISLVSALLVLLCVFIVATRRKMPDETEDNDNDDNKHEDGYDDDKLEAEVAYTCEGPYGNDNNIADVCEKKVWNDGVRLVNMLYSTSNGSKISDKQMNIVSEEESKQRNERIEIKQWLTKVVELPQYYDVFIRHGFDKITLIKSIRLQSELEQIGIESMAHQIRLMAMINELETNVGTNGGEDVRVVRHLQGERDIRSSVHNAKPYSHEFQTTAK
eukprot:325903_1